MPPRTWRVTTRSTSAAITSVRPAPMPCRRWHSRWRSPRHTSRMSFFFVSQADLFEEAAKFRAVRRFYAKMMKEHFGAKKANSMRLRFHAQTAAATLTKPQPMVNIVRTALQALSAVLGGAQSIHTNGLDEAYT